NVADLAQLVRVIKDTANTAGLLKQLQTAGATPLIDPSQLAIMGQSLGGIESALFLAVAPEPSLGVFNVTGGHIFDIFATGDFHTVIDPFLAMSGIMRDSAAYVDLAGQARWILDPVDPFALARRISLQPVVSYLTQKRNPVKLVIQQESGMD